MMENKTKIDLKNKSIFITGVAGFIGSNLAKRLLSTVEGVKVVGLDNMNNYYDVRLKEARLKELEQFEKFNFVKGNLADKAVIESIFEQYKPEIVVNLGAQAGVRYSITNPDAYVEANLIGFYNILEACRHSYDEGHTPVEHLVYASSSSVYGSNKKVPYSTDDKVDNPVSLYAATKKSNELMAHAYSKLYNIPSTGLRFFTVYGPAGRPDMAYFGFTNKLLKGKTAKSILISCGARLAPFDIAELRDLMAYDEMELDLLGDRRTALFVIISDTDDTFNFVVSIMYTQLFNLLCDRADDQCGGQLKYHVRLLLDEFANIGLIPKFDKLIATIRSREISASIILQSQSQLKTIYKDAAETIIGNCDTMLFLGGKESSTLKEISETLGKETIDLYNTSDTRGQSPSFGTTYQKTGKELMSRDELSVMDGSKCILQLRGVRPFLSDKFDITEHKRYKELSDFDKKNAFDVERYLKHELRLRMDEEFDCYEVDMSEESTA